MRWVESLGSAPLSGHEVISGRELLVGLCVSVALQGVACGPGARSSVRMRAGSQGAASRPRDRSSGPSARGAARPRALSSRPGVERLAPPARVRPRPREKVSLLQQIELGSGRPVALAPLPGGVAVLDESGAVWLVRRGRVELRFKPHGRNRDVQASADGRWLLLTSRTGTNRVYDLEKRPPARSRVWKRARRRDRGRTQGLSRHGRMLVRGDVRHQVRGYELATYKMKWLRRAAGVVLSRDGRVAVLWGNPGIVRVDAASGRSAAPVLAVRGRLRAVAFAGRDRGAWVEQQGSVCRLVLVGPGAGGAPGAPASPGAQLRRLRVGCSAAAALAISPRGALVVLFGADEVTVVARASGRIVATHRLPGHVLLAAVTGERDYVVSGLVPRRLMVFRVALGTTAESRTDPLPRRAPGGAGASDP